MPARRATKAKANVQKTVHNAVNVMPAAKPNFKKPVAKAKANVHKTVHNAVVEVIKDVKEDSTEDVKEDKASIVRKRIKYGYAEIVIRSHEDKTLAFLAKVKKTLPLSDFIEFKKSLRTPDRFAVLQGHPMLCEKLRMLIRDGEFRFPPFYYCPPEEFYF